MATQGVCSVVKNGIVVAKIVAGCNGYVADELAAAIVANRPDSLADYYKLALKLRFGGEEDLVAVNDIEAIHEGDITFKEEASKLLKPYFDTVQDPRWNPRWKDGGADYAVVVTLK